MSKIEIAVEVKSPADKFWGAIKESTKLFPEIFPEQYKSIEIVEGDGQSVGSVRLIKYAEGIPIITFSKERVETADEESKSVSYTVIDGDISNFYKHFKASLQVVPKGEGSCVKWSVEYEKATEEVPEPNLIQEFAVKTFSDLDTYLLNLKA
ncbi:PREDICTED: MLP-like protein 423 [Nelumbo nucifera]|uniref:MLP-like protein 423 n=1 Tax=Nelumbo nucifera TaxID=4432 RepID=A0A1U8B6X8_NELNU|nr:PREDICTED: MLP-like protein 423 [Nelumbo nucifera]